MKQIICYKCGQSLERINDACPEKHKRGKKGVTYKKLEHYIERRLHPTGWDKKMEELEANTQIPIGGTKGISRNKGRKWTKEHKQALIDNSRQTKEGLLGKIIKNI